MCQPFGTRTGRKTEAATLQPLVDSGMQEFKHDLTTMGDECDCLTVSTFFGTTLLGNYGVSIHLFQCCGCLP